MTRAWRRAKEFLSIKNKESVIRRVLRRFFRFPPQTPALHPLQVLAPDSLPGTLPP
jgi:hypothetical protein